MENSSPRMAGGTRGVPVNCSPAVAANAEGEEIEVLESTDVLPVAPEDVSVHRGTPSYEVLVMSLSPKLILEGYLSTCHEIISN